MQEVEAICSRVLIINNGKLIADGTLDVLKAGKVETRKQIIVEFDKSVSLEILNERLPIIDLERKDKNTFLLFSSGKTDLRPLVFDFCFK